MQHKTNEWVRMPQGWYCPKCAPAAVWLKPGFGIDLFDGMDDQCVRCGTKGSPDA